MNQSANQLNIQTGLNISIDERTMYQLLAVGVALIFVHLLAKRIFG